MPYLDLEFDESAELQLKYRDLLREHSTGIRKAVDFLLRALQLMMAAQAKANGHHHAVVFLLARHVAEELDAASVLVGEGCTVPRKLHLRSAFEAQLGVRYILKSNSERRALGYLVKHTRERIRLYDKIDPGSQAGVELRSQIGREDLALSVLSSLPPFDYATAKNRLSGMLQRPPYREQQIALRGLRRERTESSHSYWLVEVATNPKEGDQPWNANSGLDCTVW